MSESEVIRRLIRRRIDAGRTALNLSSDVTIVVAPGTAAQTSHQHVTVRQGRVALAETPIESHPGEAG